MKEPSENLMGIDIGGTKCAVTYGVKTGDALTVVDKEMFPTTEVNETISHICSATKAMMRKHGLNPDNTHAIGISCGGPLDSRRGVVMSPPNLPGWDDIPITDIIQKETGILCGLQNDANACALAEWKFGAGRGTRDMVFLTFGTGMGAGIIANGQLLTGTNDNAGEVGHVRMAETGPVGYGKAGSFEGFVSGGGIAQLARKYVSEVYQKGGSVDWCKADEINSLSARKVAEAAGHNDQTALDIMHLSARYLGMGLSILIDILNPEVIVIGSIFTRNEAIMRPVIEDIIEREALDGARRVCRILPAELGESIGDYAALSIAANIK